MAIRFSSRVEKKGRGFVVGGVRYMLGGWMRSYAGTGGCDDVKCTQEPR